MNSLSASPSSTSGTITLNYNSYYILVGGTLRLTATTNPSGKAITWVVVQNDLASVTSTGIVTAKAVGDAYVIARCEELDIAAVCILHIMNITVLNSSPIVSYGDSYGFAAYARPSSESISFNVHPSLSVSGTGDPNILNVSCPNIGNYYIRPFITGHADLYRSYTIKCVPKIIFGKINIKLVVGDTCQNSVTVRPSEYVAVTWTSLDPDIATVNNTGLIVAVAPGRARIKVSVDGFSDAYVVTYVTVSPRVSVTGISIPSSITVTAGTTYQLNAVVSPANATNQKLEWSSDHPLVAVDGNGLLTLYGACEAKITVRSAENRDILARCNVRVEPGRAFGSVSKRCVFRVITEAGILYSYADVLISHEIQYLNQPFYDYPMNLLDRGTYIMNNIMCMMIYDPPSQYPNPVFDASVSIIGESASYTNGTNSASFSPPASHASLPSNHTHFETGIAYYLRCGAWSAGMQKLSNNNPITVTFSCVASCPDAWYPATVEGSYTFTP